MQLTELFHLLIDLCPFPFIHGPLFSGFPVWLLFTNDYEALPRNKITSLWTYAEANHDVIIYAGVIQAVVIS
jgi:hypothetical protein